MDWKRLDRARRSAGPIEVDLIEAYAQGKIKRRDFVKRGTVIGLSMPFMGAIIAACGGSDDETEPADPLTSEAGGADATAAPSSDGEGGGTPGGDFVAAIQQGDANSGLDPVNMLDLGTYCVVSQCMEYLVGLGDDGDIGPTALATEWEPNDDGSEWTFTLREGVKWQDGSDFTSADVAATMDRLVAQGNAGLAGVIAEGSVDSSDPAVAVFTLEGPNGNFPYLVSVYNSQALIAPEDYSSGTTLDERPAGTGPWVFESFDPASFIVRYSPNPNWWNGEVTLDSLELRGFDGIAPQVTAMSGGEVDAIQQFSVVGGEGLLSNDNFTVLEPPSVNHRQIWFNTADDQWTDKLVRQALAWAVDREQMVQTLFDGRARLANDHPVLDSLAFYDPDAVEQRSKNVEMAKSLLAEAGVDSISATIQCGDLQEIPQVADLLKQNAAEIGVELTVDVQSNSTFYEDDWCPQLYGVESSDPATLPCETAAAFGIVDYGHRPVPDVFFNSALKSGGVWNSSNYANKEFDDAFAEYQSSVDVEGQTSAITTIEKNLWDNVPAIYPFFYNYLSGHSANVQNMDVTALGHIFVGKATKN